MKDSAASHCTELCWEVDEQLPLDRGQQWTGSGDGAVGPTMPCEEQMW